MPGLWAQSLPNPSGVRMPWLKASCDTVQLCKLRSAAGKTAVRESTGGSLTGHLSSHQSCIPAHSLALGPCQSYSAGLSTPGHLPCWSWPWIANLISWIYPSPQTCLVIARHLVHRLALFLFGYHRTPHFIGKITALPTLLSQSSLQLAFLHQVTYFVLHDKWDRVASRLNRYIKFIFCPFNSDWK